MKKLIVILSISLVGLTASWYFDIWHESVETVDELIGHNYDYAHKLYFQTDPDIQYKVNINSKLNEFDGGILNKKEILTDSIVYVFTWDLMTHKKTIWVGQTKKMKNQIIDAIRYKYNVQF
ncbi:MAG: hypothetical protein WED10_09725 [Brumimicrobium sp.]